MPPDRLGELQQRKSGNDAGQFAAGPNGPCGLGVPFGEEIVGGPVGALAYLDGLPISTCSGLPVRTWRMNSRGDAWAAADPITCATTARTSHRGQSVGLDQSSVVKLASWSANLRACR